MSAFKKSLKRIIRHAEAHGWTVIHNGHIKFKGPDGQLVICSSTPSCPYALAHVERDLAHVGCPLP